MPSFVMWPAALAGGVDAGERLGAAGHGHITRAFDGKVLPPTHQERGSCPMLERYFVKPTTIDRIRGSWIAAEIETYVAWLVDQGYSTKSIWRRVPIAFAFGEFAGGRGASAVGDLPAHVEAFVADSVARHDARTGST